MLRAMTARLVTIPFSHYCEKARWALDRAGIAYEEDGHLPLFHYLATVRARAGRTVPVLVTGDQVVADSTDIVAFADDHRPGSLLPPDPQRGEALALEDDFDRQLGPATRRWAYFHLMPRREAIEIMASVVPRWEFAALRVTRPLAFGFLRRGLKIDPEGVERSRAKIDDTFARVGDLLRDGRRYLTGDRFTVADLTFAALATPVLVPAEHPMPMPGIEMFPPEARGQIDRWRTSAAGKHALRMYADHRRLA
jgi:glutathione S-transferase